MWCSVCSSGVRIASLVVKLGEMDNWWRIVLEGELDRLESWWRTHSDCKLDFPDMRGWREWNGECLCCLMIYCSRLKYPL